MRSVAGKHSFKGFVWVIWLILLFPSSVQLRATVPRDAAQDVQAKKTSYIWLDVDGNPLPFTNDEEIKDFLLSSKVISTEDIPEGITDPVKVLLEKDGIRAHAVFRDVNIVKPRGVGYGGQIRLNFRDQCIYECAAYELDRLINLGRVPPVTQRKVEGRGGTIQIWVEGCMTEKERLKEGLEPPNKWKWMMQNQIMRLFDNLIYNDDRNQGNFLIDEKWNLILIDHTRAFRILEDLPQITAVEFCERKVWEGLKNLTREMAEERLGEYLRQTEIDALMKRRDKIVEYFEKRLKEKGEFEVLFKMY